MRQGILAAAFLVLSAGFASADYVVIVANVGGGRELTTIGGAGMRGMGGMAGMRGMAGGVPNMPMPGGPGMRGGQGMQGAPQGMMGGMNGMRPGMPPTPGGPAPGMRPGGGVQGGPTPPGVGGGMMGMRGGPGVGGGMMGMRGGPAGGGMMGMRGGPAGGMMMGMRGGMMMGMNGGMMMGMMGFGDADADDMSDYVIAVVEVKAKNLGKYLDQRGLVSVKLPERLGKTCQLMRNPSWGEMFVITESDPKKSLPPVSDRFKQKMENLTKEKPTVGDLLNLAEWALEHGLIDDFPTIMDKVVEAEKGHSTAVAYAKVKADLERKAGDAPRVASWRGRLLPGYKVTETPHYLLVHNSANDTAIEIKTHADHLERAFRGFYYWFALRGIALTVPQVRQVVVLTSKEDDFEQLQKILTAGPLVVDGFFARRESLAVMYSQRQDDPYRALRTFWENWSGKGYRRNELLENKNTSGVPKGGVPPGQLERAAAIRITGDPTPLIEIAEAQMLALMLKALEQEAELATVSHDASRQLLFASGLLPHNVAVPEWVLFGMGSFFETPLQSPWPTIGAPSPYYLPRWRELKAKEPNKGGLEKTAVATLRKVVTDGYFRTLPPQGKPGSAENFHYQAVLRKVRTVSWSLSYFLAQNYLDGLRRYFAELSKMPRDIELDDKVLLGCFARAFGCVDGNNKVDDAKLKALANKWYGYWQTVHFESEPIMKEIREKIVEKVKEAEEKAQKEESNSQQFPGLPSGMNPGPGSPPSGMNPRQGGPQPGGPQQGGGPQPGGGVQPPNNPGQAPSRPKR